MSTAPRNAWGEILLYDNRGDVRRTLEQHAPDLHIESSRSKKAFLARQRVARLSIVVLSEKPDADELSFVRQTLRKPRLARTAIVARISGRIAHYLASVDALLEHVVWTDELPEGLLAHVRQALAIDVLSEFIERLRTNAHIPPIILTGIVQASRALPPPASVRAMARSASVGESTFYDGWRRSLGVTPWTFLRWVRLLRGAQLGSGEVRGAAAWLGLDERTVRQHVRDVMPNAEKESQLPAYEAVSAAFAAWVEEVMRRVEARGRVG